MDPQFRLSSEEREHLLKLARNAIVEELGLPGTNITPLSSEVLDSRCGAFVTLKIDGRLRGCIGYIEAVKPLKETVVEMAKAAAFRDPRFPSLGQEEIPSTTIEISVLSPLSRIEDSNIIEVGRHGLIVEKGIYKGLLLPQVAVEHGWDKETFLEHTCEKAGLPAYAWKEPDTQIYVFSAEVFGE